MLNYPLVYDFFKNLIPTCCLICQQRQSTIICNLCVHKLTLERVSRKMYHLRKSKFYMGMQALYGCQMVL
jgi:hypothetical protein